jgi:hypothetical protein
MLGKFFAARVSGPDVTFNAVTHAREDLQVFSGSLTQVRNETATIELEIKAPDGGFFTSDRWLILSAEVNGIARELARGEIIAFPLSLAGATVSVEAVCRRADVSALVDALYAARDSEVPTELEDPANTRRGERYFSDFVYHNPITLAPSFDPIAGASAPVMTLYGEGASDLADIFDIGISLVNDPANRVTVRATTSLEQSEWNKINAAVRFIDIPLQERTTLTPNALVSAASKLTLGGGFEHLGSDVKTTVIGSEKIWTKTKVTDPFTCIIKRGESATQPIHRIDSIDVTCIVNALQPRTEELSVSVAALIGSIGSASADVDEDYVSVFDGQKLARYTKTFTYIPRNINASKSVRRTSVGSSVFFSNGDLRDTTHDIVRAIVRRAAREAIIRAHCVELTVTVRADIAAALTLKDRVTIIDLRLPGGRATGRVVGIDLNFGTQTDGVIILSCPVPSGAGIPAGEVIDAGLAKICIPEFSLQSFDSLIIPAAIDAVDSADARFLAPVFELTDAGTTQRSAIAGTDETGPIVADPAAAIPQTGISIDFADLSAAIPEDVPLRNFKLKTCYVELPTGISI